MHACMHVCQYVWSGQVWSGLVRSGQVRSRHVTSRNLMYVGMVWYGNGYGYGCGYGYGYGMVWYACICVYLCIVVYSCVYVCIFVYICVCVYIYIYVCVLVGTHWLGLTIARSVCDFRIGMLWTPYGSKQLDKSALMQAAPRCMRSGKEKANSQVLL